MKSGKLVLFILMVVLVFATLTYASLASDGYVRTTFRMTYGEDIGIAYWTGSDTTHTIYNSTLYPSATAYDTSAKAPRTYNCHTFSFIYDGNVSCFSMLSNSEIFLIDDSIDKLLPPYNPCIRRVNSLNELTTGDIIVYEQLAGDGTFGLDQYWHSGIVTALTTTIEEVDSVPQRVVDINSVKVLSKWGTDDLYYHYALDCPYGDLSSNDMNITYQLDDSIEMDIQIHYFRPSHRYTYTAKIIPAPRPSLPSYSTHHFAKCSQCGAFHYEVHHYVANGSGTFSCADCGYFSGVTIHKVEDEVS